MSKTPALDVLHFFLCHDHSTTTAWNCRRRKRKDNFFLACGVLQFNYRKIRLHLLFANYLPHRGFLQCYFAPETPKHCLSTIPFQCVEFCRTELALFKCNSQNVKGTDNSKLIVFSLYLHNKIRGSQVCLSQPLRYANHWTQKIWSFFLSIITFKCVQMSFTKGGRGIYWVFTPLKRLQSRLRT